MRWKPAGKWYRCMARLHKAFYRRLTVSGKAAGKVLKPPNPPVHQFHEHHIEERLAELLEMAEAGTINGLIFAARMAHTSSPYRHATRDPYLFGGEGRLLDNKAEAIGAAVLLQNKLASDA